MTTARPAKSRSARRDRFARLGWLALAAGAGVLLSGCSLLIAQGGKHPEKIFTATASAGTIRKELGPPTEQWTYPQPRPASEIPDLAKLATLRTNLSLAAPVGSRADYHFKGRVYDGIDPMICWTIDKSTLGIGEIFAFPFSIDAAIQESRLTHWYRVWYRPDGSYFAHDELSARIEKVSK